MNDANNKSSALFTPSGCLTGDSLMSFVSGTLQVGDFELAKQHIAGCPLCADSVDGLKMWLRENKPGQNMGPDFTGKQDSVSSEIPGLKPSEGVHPKGTSGLLQHEFQARTETINERIRHRVHSHSRPDETANRRISYKPFVWLAVAATIVIFIGVFYVFWVQNLARDQKLAEKPAQEMAPAANPENAVSVTDSISSETPALSLNVKSRSARNKALGKVEATTEEMNPVIYNEDQLSQNIPVEIQEVAGEAGKNGIVSDAQPMEPDTSGLYNTNGKAVVSGVVVTALGISKQKKSMAYSSMDSQKEQLNKSSTKIEKMPGRTRVDKMAGEAEKPVFTIVEEMPSFPGGDIERNKFLSGNIVYPQQAAENGVQGTVYISFIVDIKGKISDVKVLRGIGGGCDEEAVRVVEMMPKWLPGKQNGKRVRVLYNMPVYFKLTQ